MSNTNDSNDSNDDNANIDDLQVGTPYAVRPPEPGAAWRLDTMLYYTIVYYTIL